MQEAITISTPLTEHWVAWAMLCLMLMLALVRLFSPGRYLTAFRSLATTKERDSIFVGAGADNRTRATLTIYGILIVAFAAQWFWYDGTSFSAQSYLIAVSCVACTMLIRFLAQQAIAHTFFENGEVEVFSRHYHYLMDCCTLLLFPILLCAIFSSVPRIATLIVLGVLVVFYVGVLTYKLLACMPLTLLSLLYVPLYIITIELLPLTGMVFAVGKWC